MIDEQSGWSLVLLGCFGSGPLFNFYCRSAIVNQRPSLDFHLIDLKTEIAGLGAAGEEHAFEIMPIAVKGS